MKKILLMLILPLLCSNTLTANGKSVEAYFNYCTFYAPNGGPFIETYLSVIGNSLSHQKIGNKKQAKVEITLVFKKGEKIVDFKKFNLSGPEVDEASAELPNFIDQQRFSLQNGVYELEVEIKDLNAPDGQKLSVTEQLTIDIPDNDIIFSDIQLVESFKKTEKQNILSKSGYDLIPYVSFFYPKSLTNLTFYVEVYNTSKVLGVDEKFLINYYIESAEKNVKLSNYNSFSRKSSADVAILLGDFPIDKLISGNYNLVLEARNKNNELLSQKKLFIQRSNSGVELNINDLASVEVEQTFVSKMNNNDSLVDFIRSIRPISSSLERTFADNQLKSSDLKLKQQFFYNFWFSHNPLDPEKAWLDYYENVKVVNAKYGSRIRRGYDSDRGRIYLQYGEPNTISQQYA
ncbi:MAG: GWxTD domain-containing protein, partial [Bacteroidetes bacterium]|nr:GWxTD domain-containing protein [Bacteroidota bacterium]